MRPWSLASSIPVLGLESVCPRKGCPWPWPRIFLCPWPWPQALCPRLHLCLYSNRHCISLLRQVDKSVTVIKRMGKFDWCAVIEKQWCNLWKRQNVLSLQQYLHYFKCKTKKFKTILKGSKRKASKLSAKL